MPLEKKFKILDQMKIWSAYAGKKYCWSYRFKELVGYGWLS